MPPSNEEAACPFESGRQVILDRSGSRWVASHFDGDSTTRSSATTAWQALGPFGSLRPFKIVCAHLPDDRRTLMELGGWKEGRMLDEVYAHTTDAHKAEVMARSGVAPRLPPGTPTS